MNVHYHGSDPIGYTHAASLGMTPYDRLHDLGGGRLLRLWWREGLTVTKRVVLYNGDRQTVLYDGPDWDRAEEVFYTTIATLVPVGSQGDPLADFINGLDMDTLRI